jgi:hypothetical protein
MQENGPPSRRRHAQHPPSAPTALSGSPPLVPWYRGGDLLWRPIRWLVTPFKLFLGYDVFVSYARADGSGYVDSLVDRLDEVIAPRSDVHEAAPGVTLPLSLLASLVSSRVLVVLCTPMAARSASVSAEVTWFVRLSGGPVLPIEIGQAATEAIWWSRIAGVPRIAPDQDLPRIRQCVGFWTRSRRLTVGLVALAVAFIALAVMSVRARHGFAALSDVEKASRLSDPDSSSEGEASAARALFAVRSWRTSPNPAALQIMGDVIGKLPRPVIGWYSGVEPIVAITTDPSGMFVAVADRDSVAVFRRDGHLVSQFPVPVRKAGVQLVLTAAGVDVTARRAGRGIGRRVLSRPCRALADGALHDDRYVGHVPSERRGRMARSGPREPHPTRGYQIRGLQSDACGGGTVLLQQRRDRVPAGAGG